MLGLRPPRPRSVTLISLRGFDSRVGTEITPRGSIFLRNLANLRALKGSDPRSEMVTRILIHPHSVHRTPWPSIERKKALFRSGIRSGDRDPMRSVDPYRVECCVVGRVICA